MPANGHLNVYSGSTTKGTQLIIWPCDGRSKQYWFAGMESYINVRSDMYMTVAADGTADGDKVIQWPFTGGYEQLWY